MISKLEQLAKKYREVTEKLADGSVSSNPSEYQRLAREEASMRPLMETYARFQKVRKELEGNREILSHEKEATFHDLAAEEVKRLEGELSHLGEELKILLLPKDPNDNKNIFLEIRAGTGGEEAALFASELFRMYSRYAEREGWTVEMVSSNPTGIGGFKEIISLISGKGVYSRLKYESGVHRVQRVPRTEASGRIHTSAVTVAVMPEADEVDVKLEEKDLRIDVFRSGGHGGQSVNTTDSAVRITHLPSGLVVVCQDEKSQHKNKAKAMKVLRARLLDRMITEQREAEATARKEQVGSGDRSEKIRTYNYPQSRVTDHRISLTLYQLDTVLDGDLNLIVSPLVSHFQAEALKKQ